MHAFSSLFDLADDELAAQNAHRYVVDNKPGYPCRVSLIDAEVGETVILLPYVHQPVSGPYRSKGPIFIREGATAAELKVNEIPHMLRHRLLSVRGYNERDIMITTNVVQGSALDGIIEQMFTDKNIAYLHLHNAGPGCYNCRVDRA